MYDALYRSMRAAVTAARAFGYPPLQVQFRDQSTPAGAAGAWQWAFGDGGSSSLPRPVYTYAATESYTVTLASATPPPARGIRWRGWAPAGCRQTTLLDHCAGSLDRPSLTIRYLLLEVRSDRLPLLTELAAASRHFQSAW